MGIQLDSHLAFVKRNTGDLRKCSTKILISIINNTQAIQNTG